tara:strand:- start:1780 stop:2097 length:318 start_codon:yes stop_codon:yes gene_type:complete
MELKDRALKAFWIWYLLPEQRKTYKTDSLIGNDPAIKIRFLAMSFTERFGVYVDFFDSVGIDIEIYTTIHGFDFMIKTNIFRGYFETRAEARATAIEKANEIYNQ